MCEWYPTMILLDFLRTTSLVLVLSAGSDCCWGWESVSCSPSGSSAGEMLIGSGNSDTSDCNEIENNVNRTGSSARIETRPDESLRIHKRKLTTILDRTGTHSSIVTKSGRSTGIGTEDGG